MRYLLTWIGEHTSTIDGRVIQVRQTHPCESVLYAHGYACELAKHAVNSSIELWQLVEALPYGYDGTSTEVEL